MRSQMLGSMVVSVSLVLAAVLGSGCAGALDAAPEEAASEEPLIRCLSGVAAGSIPVPATPYVSVPPLVADAPNGYSSTSCNRKHTLNGTLESALPSYAGPGEMGVWMRARSSFPAGVGGCASGAIEVEYLVYRDGIWEPVGSGTAHGLAYAAGGCVASTQTHLSIADLDGAERVRVRARAHRGTAELPVHLELQSGINH